MADNIFEISVDNGSYRMVLPHWETDYIQRTLASTRQPYEFEMLKAMADMLKPGDLVLDVGANIGNHSLYLAVVADCQIFAFEPNINLCRALKQSIEINNLNNKVLLWQAGVGKEFGKAHFSNITPENLGAQSLTVDTTEKSDISIITLDSLGIQEKVRAIKIDVEGMELSVIEGGIRLITQDRPCLFVEAQSEDDFEALHKLIVDLGYIYWNTFNATPTHWFIHQDKLNQSEIIEHYFEKGKDSYKLRLAKRELQKKLNEANLKYRGANERINDLKLKLDAANEKYKSATAQAANIRQQSKIEIEQLHSQLSDCRSKLSTNTPESKKYSNDFDFSIDNKNIG